MQRHFNRRHAAAMRSRRANCGVGRCIVSVEAYGSWTTMRSKRFASATGSAFRSSTGAKSLAERASTAAASCAWEPCYL